MRAINLIVLAGLGLALTRSPLSGSPVVESGPGSETNSCALLAETRHEEGPGQLPADRAYLRAGTNRFCFLIPSGLKLETWSDGRVALVTRDYNCQIVFRIAGPPLLEGSELNPDSCSQWIVAEHATAQILKQFSAFADSRQGPAYEVGLTGTAGAPRRGEIAFIPSRVGILEFSLLCSPENFEAARRQLHTVMLTFRASDARGELHISPLSDKI
jgi:hypothetical protein